MKHLYSNADVYSELIIQNVSKETKYNPYYGYNLSKNIFVDNIINEGIIDSYLTMKTAIEDAVSVASLIITTECIVFKEINYERNNIIINILAPPLEAFKNRIKNDPQYRAQIEKQFYDSSEEKEDFKNLVNVI